MKLSCNFATPKCWNGIIIDCLLRSIEISENQNMTNLDNISKTVSCLIYITSIEKVSMIIFMKYNKTYVVY